MIPLPLIFLALAAFAASRLGKGSTDSFGGHVFVQGDGVYLGDPAVWPGVGEQTKGKNPPPYPLGTIYNLDPDKLPLTKENRAFIKTALMELVGYRYAISIGMYRYRVRLTINGTISPCQAGYSELILTRGINSGAFKPLKVA